MFLIGRDAERRRLTDMLDKRESQFCAVYGRRRVGKTYLVRQVLGEHINFSHSGVANAPKDVQLNEFRISLMKAGLPKCGTLKNWYEAFHALCNLVEAMPDGKKVLFIDELSWMDTPKSNFISALEHFWNGFANLRTDVVLVVCGSATSWIINNVIRNHGGLYNRVTEQIYLQPFCLKECEQMLHSMSVEMSRKDIAEAYMIFGGIPFYWNFLRRDESLAQNIDRMFFATNAPLAMEYDALYASIFKNPASHMTIVKALGQKKVGMSRNDILRSTNLADNTHFSQVLRELQQCGFIRCYYAFGKKERDAIYQLTDNFTLFYFKFMRENHAHDEQFWSKQVGRPIHSVWAGLAFERLCLWHLPQIKQALGINGIASSVHAWSTPPTDEHEGTQIDLLIDRGDHVINLCEMKFASETFTIDKQYDQHLMRRKAIFRSVTQTKKALHTTMITTFGVMHNAYWSNIQSEVTIDQLFV